MNTNAKAARYGASVTTDWSIKRNIGPTMYPITIKNNISGNPVRSKRTLLKNPIKMIKALNNKAKETAPSKTDHGLESCNWDIEFSVRSLGI